MMSNLDYQTKQKIALHRYTILSPLITDRTTAPSKTAFFKEAADRVYELDGKSVQYSSYTIRHWYQAYVKSGFEGLFPKTRSDNDQQRKIDEDIADQILYIKKSYPRLPATLIRQKLIDNGTIKPSDLSLSTITRFIKKNTGKTLPEDKKDRRRYERAHINEVWCGDSCTGPYLRMNGKKVKTYVIALIDDASRMVVDAQIFFNDNFVNLMNVIRSAVSKYGKPSVFNFDNGSNYRSYQMSLVSARMGSTIHYCPVRTPQSKGKIERWYNSMQMHWMAGLNMDDFKNIDQLQESLSLYVQKYNQSPHSSLNGRTPQDRFFEESYLIKYMTPQQIEETFLIEVERKVSADNVIRIENHDYEVHYRYAKQKLLIRYAPDLSRVYVVDRQTNELTELKLLDKVANSTVKRTFIRLSNQEVDS